MTKSEFLNVLCLLVLMRNLPTFHSAVSLTTVFSWKTIQFNYTTDAEKQQDIDSGIFVENKPFPIDVDAEVRKIWNVLCLLVMLCNLPTFHSEVSVTNVFSWNKMQFNYKSELEKQIDVISGLYVENVPYPMDVDAEVRNGNITRYFVTLPRLKRGSPLTLGSVVHPNVKLNPYPDWSWHKPIYCSKYKLISVFRVQYDPECNKLWVVDSGVSGNLKCPPKIVGFDLNTNKATNIFELPNSLYEARSLLVTIVVDTTNGQCSDSFIYVADCRAYSIIVYDLRNNVAWKATHKSMYPDPECGTIKIAGDQLDLMNGVAGMALSPSIGADKKLFYFALSSATMHWVYTSALRNRNNFVTPEDSPQLFNTYKTVRPTQSSGFAIDSRGVSYGGLVLENSLVCWNTRSSEYGQYLKEFYSNNVTMQFATGIKIIKDSSGEHLYIVTPRLQKVLTGTIDSNDVNYRITKITTDSIIEQGTCRYPDATENNLYSYSLCDACQPELYKK